MPVEKIVIDALNAQMGRELEAHLQYLSISSWFDGEGLPELTKFFAAQAAEEHAHAMSFLDYIQDVGGPVVIPALAAPKPRFESAEEAVAGQPGVGEERHRAHPRGRSTSPSPSATTPPRSSCSGSSPSRSRRSPR